MGLESDPLNSVPKEVSDAGRQFAQKLEDVLLAGVKLWSDMQKQGIVPKKMYFVGPKGNKADEVSDALLNALGYIPAKDGTLMMQRSQHKQYQETEYLFLDTDAAVMQLCKEEGINPVDLYRDDEDKYRKMETDALREFAENENPRGLPCGCVVGESALQRPENVEIIKQGLVFYLTCQPESSWVMTQKRMSHLFMGGGGSKFMVKPPIWALAQDMVGDVDNVEFKEEYIRILVELEKEYQAVADVELFTDTRGIAENAYWAVPKLVQMMSEHLGVKATVEGGADGDLALEKDLTDFLEGCRLSKYLDTALEWCEEQGAASMEDIVENSEEFAEAMGLKPLEIKRFNKACEGVVV